MCELLAKLLKKFSKSLASRFSFLHREMWSSVLISINRVTLQHNKKFIMFIFYLMVLSMGNLQKRLIRAAF